MKPLHIHAHISVIRKGGTATQESPVPRSKKQHTDSNERYSDISQPEAHQWSVGLHLQPGEEDDVGRL